MRAAEFLDDDDESRWLEALDWHAQRCAADTLTPQQQEAWRHWLLDGDNRRVYAACAQLYQDAQVLEDTPAVVQSSGRRAFERMRIIGSAVRWTLAATVLSACAASTVLSLPGARTLRPRPVPQHSTLASTLYRSAAGQTRRIRLADGSTVVLGAETVLSVAITPHRRALDLERGEAWFDVVHHPHWPFVVAAGAGVIRDLGTAFVVDRESGRTEVTVTQGQVEVSLSGMPRAPRLGALVLKPIRLRRGERFVYGKRIPAAIGRVSPHLALGWTRGRLEFVNEPLGDVAQNLSRYSRRPIVVTPAAANLHLTTLVLSHHIRAWIVGLSRVLPVVAVRTSRGVCIRLRASVQTSKNNACHDP